jgi:membrane protein implicated in regulation of membrane protease activity
MQALIDFYHHQPLWAWMAIAAALLAAEVATSTGWLLWPAASAAIVGVIAYFIPLPVPVALLLFAVITIVTTLLGRRFTPRSQLAQGGDINDLHARLVGQRGRVATAFAQGEGRVLVDGKEWPAILDGGGALGAESAVEVTGFSGARLTVRPADPRPPGTT